MNRRGYIGKKRTATMLSLITLGIILGAWLFGVSGSSAAEEKAIASKTWPSVKSVIETKVGQDYYEVGQCTGYIYWCLKYAYGVDWGTNSYVDDLEEKMKKAGITKVAEGSSGKVTSEMKPGDIVIFSDGSRKTHCAILGDKGRLYHAIIPNVSSSITLSEWMKLADEEKNCDRYTVYRGLISEGTLTIKKTSSNTEITDNNDCYSLEGAEYGLYKDAELIGKLKTDKSGRASLAAIPFGKYTLKELVPSVGYALDIQEHEVIIDKSSVIMELKEQPQYNNISAVIHKMDREIHEYWDEENRGQFGASLENALYSVTYYDGYYDENTDFAMLDHMRAWVIKTDASGEAGLYEDSLISGDELYRLPDDKIVLPLGTVVIREMKAPKGYVLDDTVHIVKITSQGTKEEVETFVIPVHKEQIMRGNIRLIKIEDGSMRRLSGVPFKVTSKTTGESHILTTDENGCGESSGLWFGKPEARSEFMGALPYDTYILDELPCESNKNHNLIEDVEFSIYKNNSLVDLGTLTNDFNEEYKTPYEDDDENGSIQSKESSVVETGDRYSRLIIAANIMILAALMGFIVFIGKRRLG